MKRKIIKHRKANAIAFNPIVWAILGLLVLAVALSVLNLIKDNSDKTNADDLINAIMVKSDGFVPGDWGEFASNDYKTAYASTMTLKLTIDIMAEPGAYKKLDPNYKESTDKTKEPSLVGEVIKNVIADESTLKCCRYKPKDYSQTLYYWNKGECTNEEVSTTFCPTNTKCLEKGYVNIENGPCFKCTEKGCDIDEFELPQDLASEGIASYADFLAFHTEPKFILYFQEFPRGEETTWQDRDSTLFLVGIGAQVLFSLILPGSGKAIKGMKNIKNIEKASAEIFSATQAAAKAGETVEEIAKDSKVMKANEKLLESLKNSGDSDFIKGLYKATITRMYGEHVGIAMKNLDSMKFYANIKAETMAKRLGIVDEQLFLKFLRDPYLEDSSKIGLSGTLENLMKNENDILAPIKLKPKDWEIFEYNLLNNPRYKGLISSSKLDELKRAEVMEDFINTLSKNPDLLKKQFAKFDDSSRFLRMKETDIAQFEKRIDEASVKVSQYLDEGNPQNYQNMFKDVDIDELANTLKANENNIIELFKDTTITGWKGSMNLFGSPKGELVEYLEILFKGGIKCGVSVAAGGALTVGAVTIGAVSGGVGAMPFVHAIGYTAIAGAKGCYQLTRTSIYPILLLFTFIKEDMDNSNEKFAFAGENAFALKVNDDYNLAPVSEKLNIGSYPLIMKSSSGDMKEYRPFYFVSPCNANLNVNRERCSTPLMENKVYLVKNELGKVSFIPLTIGKDKEGNRLKINMDEQKIHKYYLWDYLTNTQKSSVKAYDFVPFSTKGIGEYLMGVYNVDKQEKFISTVLYNYDDFKYFSEKTLGCGALVDSYSRIYDERLGIDGNGNTDEERIRNTKLTVNFIGFQDLSKHMIQKDIASGYFIYSDNAIVDYLKIKFVLNRFKETCKNNADLVYNTLYNGFDKDSISLLSADYIPSHNYISNDLLSSHGSGDGINPSDFEDAISKESLNLQSDFFTIIETKEILEQALKEEVPSSLIFKEDSNDVLGKEYNKEIVSYDYKTLKSEKKKVAFRDYIFRQMYLISFFIDEKDYQQYSNSFIKDITSSKISNSPSKSNIYGDGSDAELETQCYAVNFKNFNNGENANYCYAAKSEVAELAGDITMGVGIVGGILSLGYTGGGSLGVILGAADLADIGTAVYIHYTSQYPKNGISGSDLVGESSSNYDS